MTIKYGWDHFDEDVCVDETELINTANQMECGTTIRTRLKKIRCGDMEAALFKISGIKYFVFNCHANIFYVSRHR